MKKLIITVLIMCSINLFGKTLNKKSFSIKLPNEAVKAEGAGNYQFNNQYVEAGTFNIDKDTMFSIKSKKISSEKPDEDMKKMIDDMRSEILGIYPYQKDSVKFKDLDAFRVLCKGSYEKAEFLSFVKGDRVYGLVFVTDINNYLNRRKQVYKIFNSIKFKNSKDVTKKKIIKRAKRG